MAVNCCETPACRVTLAGEIETEIGAGAGIIVTVAFAALVGSAAAAAVTTTDGLDGTLFGAL